MHGLMLLRAALVGTLVLTVGTRVHLDARGDLVVLGHDVSWKVHVVMWLYKAKWLYILQCRDFLVVCGGVGEEDMAILSETSVLK